MEQIFIGGKNEYSYWYIPFGPTYGILEFSIINDRIRLSKLLVLIQPYDNDLEFLSTLHNIYISFFLLIKEKLSQVTGTVKKLYKKKLLHSNLITQYVYLRKAYINLSFSASRKIIRRHFL